MPSFFLKNMLRSVTHQRAPVSWLAHATSLHELRKEVLIVSKQSVRPVLGLDAFAFVLVLPGYRSDRTLEPNMNGSFVEAC